MSVYLIVSLKITCSGRGQCSASNVQGMRVRRGGVGGGVVGFSGNGQSQNTPGIIHCC